MQHVYLTESNKALDVDARLDFMVGNTFNVLLYILAGRIRCVHETVLRVVTWKLVPGSHGVHPCSFSFPDFNLCLFAVISHNHQYNSFSESCESF